MSDQSPILSLPLIQAAQAQKHVTHNEALMRLDYLVQLRVSDRTLTTPPGSPVEGQRHIVATGASGAWAGQEGDIALWQDGAWQFQTPQEGWRAFVMAETLSVTRIGSGWVADGLPSTASFTQVGVSAAPDASNRLSVSSPATLLNHAGAGHQLKLNKAASGNTASVLFQTGFSGRAEMGTTGSDDFALKVSPDGSAFSTALTIATSTAEVAFAKPVILEAQASDPASPTNGEIWYNGTAGALLGRTGGITRILDGQQECPWLIPPAGEYVLTTSFGGTSTGTVAGVADRLEMFTFIPRATIQIDRLGINCTTAVAAALAKIVIYSSDAQGRPDALVHETGTLDLSTTGNKTATVSLTLSQGRPYWLGLRNSSTATVSAWHVSSTPDINGGTTMVTTSRKTLRRTVAFATAAPSSWGFLSSEISSSIATAIWLRIA